MILQVAPTAATVLITGESGTGKELVACAIHEKSARAGCLLSRSTALLFPRISWSRNFSATKKGPSPARRSRMRGFSKLRTAERSCSMKSATCRLQLQAKLLRVLQEGEVRRVGATHVEKSRRALAGSHASGSARVGCAGKFRQDLLYRLEVVRLPMPALRERMADLPDLVYTFLKQFAQKHSKNMTQVSEEAMAILLGHAWPGNIRELSNVIERAVIFAQSERIEA